jgi:RNA polymerase sigma-70 factor (ECF subfamily)
MLLKIALMQLHNRDEAEDVVQETLAAALQASASFAGKSSLRTWLVGILKHKIIDQIRRSRSRPDRPLELREDEASLEDFDALFSPDGHYAEMPADWGNPEAALSQARFHEALQRCLDGLPANTARAFVMREVMGMDTAEICKELGVSTTNCWVLLYRARMSLRVCLQQGWFAGDERTA